MSSVADRQRAALQVLADLRDGQTPVARLAVGDSAGAQRIIASFIDANARRVDCANFRLIRMIRAKLMFGDLLPPAVHEAIAGSLLSARYYGGWRDDFPMYYSSENHHLCWAATEYLAAQLYPDATFEFDSRSASAHRDRARFLIASWIDRRARWGSSEWNSNPYMNVNVASLLSLIDFADEPAIRQLATDMMTRLLADLFADSAQGGLWGAQARVYVNDLFHRGEQSIALPLWVYSGQGDLPKGHAYQSLSAEMVVTSTYRPPAWLERVATLTPLTNLECHRMEVGVYYHNRSLYWRPPLELTNERARQQFLPSALVPIPIRTERREGYIVSAAIFTQLPVPHRENMSQGLAWIGCLDGRASIFTTHPKRPGRGYSDREYWAGSATVPRCFLHEGLLAAVYPGDNNYTEDFTHAHFPTPEFDEWHNDGRWFFARAGQGLVGLFAPSGTTLASAGSWAGRELVAPGRSVAWLAAFSSIGRDGTMQAFIERCRKIDVRHDPNQATVKVSTPDVRFTISYDHAITLNGEPIRFDGWPQMHNEMVHADYGSPKTHIRTDEGEVVLDFSSAEKIMAEWERGE